MRSHDPKMEMTDGRSILYGHYQRFQTEVKTEPEPLLSPYARGYAILMTSAETRYGQTGDRKDRKQRLYYSPGPRRQWTGNAGFAEIFSTADAARSHIAERLGAISSRCAVVAL